MERIYTKQLLDWYKKPRRKPLIMWGARKVGKTYLLKELFLKKYFKDYVYIDFSKHDDLSNYFNSTCNPQNYLDYIETRFGKRITPEVPLVMDEIQNCPLVLTSLKYFCEDYRSLPIIATGSMVRLSVQKNKKELDEKHFLFPTGKIDSITIYPLTFEEFLMNTNPRLQKKIIEAYNTKQPLESIYHSMAMSLLHQYLLLGGLPEVIDTFLQTKSYVEATEVLNSVYKSYLCDMEFYNISTANILKTRKVYRNIFNELNKENKNFKVSNIEKGKSNRDFFSAYEWLYLGHLVYKCMNISEKVTIPLSEKKEGIFRLYLSDVGLFTYQSQIQQSSFINPNENNNISGIFYENYVACELVAKGIPLYYWTGKQYHEFEFIVYSNGKLYPIDAKKNKGNLNSLDEFRQYHPKATAIKISGNNFGYNKDNNILTIPHYAVFLLATDLAKGNNILPEQQ